MLNSDFSGMIDLASKNGSDLKRKIGNLPCKPGVYQFKNNSGNILYIGKAKNIRNRVRQYFTKAIDSASRIGVMVSKIEDVEIIVTDSEIEALILEATLIKKLKPHYNVDLKDDKSYPYIVITNEPFPRVFVTRHLMRDGSKYYGPYTDVKNMRGALKMVRDIFKIRSCNYFIDDEVIRKRKIKTCLDYHINKCGGPCEGLVSREKYNLMIGEVAQVLKGKTSALLNELESEMATAARETRFEEAAEIRNKLRTLSVYNARQKVIDADLTDRDLFAVAVQDNHACVIVFNVREGKMINKTHNFLSNVSGVSQSELLEQYIENYYLDSVEYPDEILLPIEIPGKDVIEGWLSAKYDREIEIKIPKIGEKVRLLKMCETNAKILLDDWRAQKVERAEMIPVSISALQKSLRLQQAPRRIECFDISNIQGTDSVASMVVFVDGRPKKSEYRKYKIQSVHGSDDFASMREVIERRYAASNTIETEFPDLIVVDGGKGQLSSALGILKELRKHYPVGLPGSNEGRTQSAAIIGLAKRLEEVFVPESSEPVFIPKSSPGLRLLQQIRNEAHRFAVTYHRTLRRKRTLQTELDLIKGIGKNRAKELLEVFGSVQGVKFASVEQLSEIVGTKIAAAIRDYYGSGKEN